MKKEEDRRVNHDQFSLVEEKFLHAIGVWPLDSDNFFSLARWSLTAIIQISSTCSLTLEIYRHCLDMDDTMDAFLLNLSFIVSFSKHCVMRFNRRHSCALVNSVMRDWATVADSRQRQVMIEYFRRGRTVSTMILSLGYASAITFVLRGLPLNVLLPSKDATNLSGSLNETFRISYVLPTYCVFGPLPFDLRSCVLLLQTLQILANATSHCGNDGFYFSLAMHLCGQFEILKMNLAEIEIEEHGSRKKLGLLVQRHCRLVVLADDFERTFNMLILVQLLMSATLLGVEGFHLLICLNAKDNGDALKRVVIIATMLVQLFLYAYAGDNLESRFGEIAYAAYASPWYHFRGRAARDMAFIINRGNSPYHVTAGKFLPMNLFTFKEILKASASYLSVLQVMMDT